MRLMAHMWLRLYLLKSPFHTLEERDIQSKMWWLHVTLICYSHLFCLDGKVQHMTPLFFLILFIKKVTTFHTHHQVCVMINQLFIIMTYCGCVNTIEFFFLGKYYVIDSGYPMIKDNLAPYKGISYHLQEFWRKGGSPRTRYEKFNHVHSSLRCTIERTFDVWKNKWRIIRNMSFFPFHIQILIVSATMTLHNFVWLNVWMIRASWTPIEI